MDKYYKNANNILAVFIENTLNILSILLKCPRDLWKLLKLFIIIHIFMKIIKLKHLLKFFY